MIIIAGPNGAGKTTASEELLNRELAIREFVNADWIAKGLSAFEPETAAIAAGRVMLSRLRELSEEVQASHSRPRWHLERSRGGLRNSEVKVIAAD